VIDPWIKGQTHPTLQLVRIRPAFRPGLGLWTRRDVRIRRRRLALLLGRPGTASALEVGPRSRLQRVTRIVHDMHDMLRGGSGASRLSS
jgi:hypothetical protein